MAERTSVSDELLRVIARRLAQAEWPTQSEYHESDAELFEVVLRDMGVGRLLDAGQAARGENQKFIDWLERMAKHSEEQAANCNFISLKEAYVADAKNFRAMSKNKRELVTAWDAAKAEVMGERDV